MKKTFKLFLILNLQFLIFNSLTAQNVSISVTGAAGDPSALLDIDAVSTPSFGVLIPRIALQAANLAAPVTSPVTSLLLYNTATASTGTNAVSPGYYYWGGTRWLRFTTGTVNAWSLTGDASTIDGTNFVGTTDNIPFNIRVNNQKAGRIDHIRKNSFWGHQAANSISTGIANTVFGCLTATALATGINNTLLGRYAIIGSNMSNCTAIGYNVTVSGFILSYSSVVIGHLAKSNFGISNVVIGDTVLDNGSNNGITIGHKAFDAGWTKSTTIGDKSRNDGNNNVTLGDQTRNSSNNSVVMGTRAFTSQSTDDISIGNYAFNSQSTKCISIGAVTFNSQASYGIAIGADARTSQSDRCIAIGITAQTSQASLNVAIGEYAIGNGQNSNAIGHLAITSGNNAMAIGYNVFPGTYVDNKTVIGNSSMTYIGGQVGWTTISDSRYKKEIKNYDLGLNFIAQLQPKSYIYNNSDNNIVYNGLLAQDVDKTLEKLSTDFSGLYKPQNESDNYGVRYGDFVIPLINALKEQQQQIEILNNELDLLYNK